MNTSDRRLMAQAAVFSAIFFAPIPGPAKYFLWGVSHAIISAIFPEKPEDGMEDSPSYAWEHTPNATASRDMPMPVVYGRTRVKPVVKNRFVTVDGDKQYLHVLYSFSGHRIDEKGESDGVKTYAKSTLYYPGDVVKGNPDYDHYEPGKTYRLRAVKKDTGETIYGYYTSSVEANIFDLTQWDVWHGSAAITDIRVNGTPIDNFVVENSEDFTYETRPGFAEQAPITGFEVTYSNYPQSTVLEFGDEDGNEYDSEFWLFRVGGAWEFKTVAVTSSETHNLEVQVRFDSGLYRLRTTDKKMKRRSAWILVQYRKVGDSEWTDFEYGDLSKLNGSLSTISYKSNSMSSWDNASVLHIDRVTAKTFTLALKAKASREEPLEEGRYEVRVAATASHQEKVEAVPTFTGYLEYEGYDYPDNPITLINVAGITYGNFTYPGEALLAIRALATEQLNGDIEVTGVVERSTVKVWNGMTWVDKPANHHAWAAYDILANGWEDHPEYPDPGADPETIQPVYGCGIPPDRIDYESFAAWASYANGNDNPLTGDVEGLGYRLNIVFDTNMTAWDAVLRICQEGRGIVYPLGAKYYAMVDRAVQDVTVDGAVDEDADVMQLFSVGNIVQGSVKHTWADAAKKANAVEVTYSDIERDYDRVEFVVKSSDWDESDTVDNPLQIPLYGTVTFAQAFAIGKYLLNCNELLTSTVEFEVDVEGLCVQAGDVVRVQHDSLTGVGGRIRGYHAATNTVTLDKEVVLELDKTYELQVQLSDGRLVRKAVTGAGTTAIMQFDAGDTWSTPPQKHDVYAFGELGSASKLYRVIDVSMSGDYKVRVVGLEYDERVYKFDPYTGDTDDTTVSKLANGSYAPGSDLSAYMAQKIAPDLAQNDAVYFNTAQNLSLKEVLSFNRTTGEYESYILVEWDPSEGESWGEWEVSWRDVDEADREWQGAWEAETAYSAGDVVEHDGKVYISITDDNLGHTPG